MPDIIRKLRWIGASIASLLLVYVLVYVLLGALGQCIGVLITPKRGGSSVSTTFVRYGTQFGLTNEVYGFFLVNNNGPHSVFCAGIADDNSRLFARVLTSNKWMESKRPWLSFPYKYYLKPGDSREVGVHLEETNVSWTIGFRYREIGFCDSCPGFIWRRLPKQMQAYPEWSTVWTSPMEGYVTN